MDQIHPDENNSSAQEPVFLTDFRTESSNDVSWIVGNDDSEDSDLPHPIEESSLISENEENSSGESEEYEPERPKKKRNSSQHRIAELNRQKKAAQEFAQQIMREKESLEKKLIAVEQEKLLTDEKFIASQKEILKSAKFNALEEDDKEKITEIDDLISQYNHELMDIRKQKKYNAHQKYQPRKQEIPEEVFDDVDDIGIDDEVIEAHSEWLKRNPWADETSRSFDEGMFNEANEYVTKLKRKYLLERRDNEIGTPDFFEQITDYMMDAYSVQKEQISPQKSRTIHMKNPNDSRITSVSTRPTGSTNNNSKKQIFLTREQKEVARGLRGFVRDERGNKIMDDSALEAYYIKHMKRV